MKSRLFALLTNYSVRYDYSPISGLPEGQPPGRPRTAPRELSRSCIEKRSKAQGAGAIFFDQIKDDCSSPGHTKSRVWLNEKRLFLVIYLNFPLHRLIYISFNYLHQLIFQFFPALEIPHIFYLIFVFCKA